MGMCAPQANPWASGPKKGPRGSLTKVSTWPQLDTSAPRSTKDGLQRAKANLPTVRYCRRTESSHAATGLERNLGAQQAIAVGPAGHGPAELDRVQLDGRTAGAEFPVPAGQSAKHQGARLA